VLVACGAAGGIAATFNAPLAGVFFAMEPILRNPLEYVSFAALGLLAGAVGVAFTRVL
jgi:chloride channel protein, CIC family